MKDLYKELENDGLLSYKEAKDVGDAVFSALLKSFKKPSSLIIKVRGLGDFFLRKKKLTEYYGKMNKIFNQDELTDIIKARDIQVPGYIQEKRDMIELMKNRLVEYDKFIEKKLNARKERKELNNKPEENVS